MIFGVFLWVNAHELLWEFQALVMEPQKSWPSSERNEERGALNEGEVDDCLHVKVLVISYSTLLLSFTLHLAKLVKCLLAEGTHG